MMFRSVPRILFASAIGLGAFGLASEASAATYVCEIELFVGEVPTPSTPVGRPVSFDVVLNNKPYCSGDQVGMPLHVENMQNLILNTKNPYDTVRTNAISQYEDTALIGVFLQLQTAAAVGLPVQLTHHDATSVESIVENASVARMASEPAPAGAVSSHRFEGYVCRTDTRADDSLGSVFAHGHELDFILTSSPDCMGSVIHDRTLRPQTESALPNPKAKGSSGTISNHQGQRLQLNLATAALGHALMMAQVGKMLVTVSENSQTSALSGVRFRARPHDVVVPPKPCPKPKTPECKPSKVGGTPVKKKIPKPAPGKAKL